jgi:hypothetical protein
MKAQNVSFDEVYDKFAYALFISQIHMKRSLSLGKSILLLLITTDQVPVDTRLDIFTKIYWL